MGVGERRRLILVDLEGDLLRQPAAVGEEQRGTVAVDEIAEVLRQRLPDLGVLGRRFANRFGITHSQGDFLAAGRIVPRRMGGRVDDGDLALRSGGQAAADVGGDRVERAHRRGQGDALELAC